MPIDMDYARQGVDRLLSQIPATLYEVGWQYSVFDWYTSMQSDDIDFELSPMHLAYLTPRAKSDLFGEPDSLIVISVDLSDPDNPQLTAKDDGPVEITTYTEADRFRVGHSYPVKKTSNMTDYSITTYKEADSHHIAGLRDDTYGTNNVQDRFTSWAQSEYAETVSDRADPEGVAILQGLATLGDKTEAMERLSDALLEEAGGEDVDLDALITVRIRIPGSNEYHFPGEIPVLNEVMVEKKAERLESISGEDASGEGVGFLDNGHDDDTEQDRVTGGSSGLFGMYGKKQREHFPNLDPKGSSAWRTRPLGLDVAAAVATADSIFDGFYRGQGNNRRLYVLPYLACRATECSHDEFEWFCESVFKPLREAEDGFDELVEEILRKASQDNATTSDDDTPFADVRGMDAWDKCRVASVLRVMGNPDRVFFDTLDAGYWPARIEDAHNQVIETTPFRGDGIFASGPDPEYSPLLGTGLRLHRYILYGGYFARTTEPTRSSEEAGETPTAGDIDDHRMRRVNRLLVGGKLAVEDLLEGYLHKVVQEQHDDFGSDSEYIPVPVRTISEQYVQLHALEAADALQPARDTSPSFTLQNQEMTDTPTSRNERLEQFLDSHGALSEQCHRATFLIGALVGRVTAYQHQQDISSTLVRRYPIDYLTKQTIKEVTKDVLQQDAEYAEAEEERSYWTNNRYTTRLTDTMLSADPEMWPTTDAELQWLYGLGIAYGLNDSDIKNDQADTETPDMGATTSDED